MLEMNLNNEKTWNPQGHARLAHLLGCWPQAAIFRRFGPLSVMTLLRLQARLSVLNEEIWTTCCLDQRSPEQSSQELWNSFAKLQSLPPDDERAKKLIEVQDTLKEYCRFSIPSVRDMLTYRPDELLSLWSQVSQLQQPERHQVRFLQKWLEGPQEGGNYLRGRERFTWKDYFQYDFVVPIQSRSWLNPNLVEFVHWLKRMWSPAKTGAKADFLDVEFGSLGRMEDVDARPSARSFRFVWRLAMVLIASVLPMLAILVLYHIKSTENRIGAGSAMTALIALLLRFFISASLKEVFAATSA